MQVELATVPDIHAQPSNPSISSWNKAESYEHCTVEEMMQLQISINSAGKLNSNQNVVASEDLIVDLLEAIEESDSLVELYNIGKALGKRNAYAFKLRYDEQLKKYNYQHFFRINPSIALKGWWESFVHRGWEKLEAEHIERDGYIFIDVFDIQEMPILDNIDESIRSLYAGLFAGFICDLIGIELSCIETQGQQKGRSHCRFLLGHREVINATLFWQTIEDLSRAAT